MAAYPETLAHPSGAQLALVPDVVLVKVASTPGASASDALGSLGLVPLGYGGGTDGPGAGALARAELPHAAVNDSPGLVFARTREGGGVDRDTVTASSEVEWTAPVYRTQVRGRDELLSPLATTLVIASDVAGDPENAAVLEEYGLVRNEARSALLGSFDLFDVPGATRPAFDIRDELAARLGTEVKLEFIPVVTPVAFQPDDPLFVQQWDMVQIDAGGAGDSAWDHQRGDSMIAVAVLDEGVDLAHPDLVGAFLHDGINLGTMSGTGAPTGNHGTPCAGIAAAPIGNATGTSGVGGGAKILPIAVQSWSAEEIAAGIRYATSQGARVISMSFGWDLWDPTVIDPAIAEAHAAEVVMCVATHNHNTQNGVTYPATNPLVMAVGASDRVDNRKSPTSPDGEQWGSNWGPQVSVVAPGVQCPAPDRTGADGYSADDYTTTFNGTSAATPHVAGLAALLLSRNPLLSGAEVRRIIETTAAKVGTVAYADDPGHPHGTWNAEMGYGRIDALAAVSATDLWVGEEQPTCRADLTGDGRADIVGFGDFGVFVSLNNGDGTFGPVTQVLDNFAHEAGGWRVGKHPRMLADLTGDGRADIVGFGDFGVFVALNNGDGTFGPVTQVADNFAHEAGGWRVGKHPRMLADLTGDGRADIVGFGDFGVFVALNNGDGTFGPVTQVSDNFGHEAGGWRVGKHPRMLADLTGDGRADIVGFGDFGVFVALNNGDGTFGPVTQVADNFAHEAGGWRVGKHPRMLADLTGDGRADIVGFGDFGVFVALNNGDGTFGPGTQVVDNFAHEAGGWRVTKHPRMLADLTGDGRADIVGFGDFGVFVALNNGDGTFGPVTQVSDNFAHEAGGWRVMKHPRTLADLTGDGRADIVGFGDFATFVALNNGDGTFGPVTQVVDNFAHETGGWRVTKHPRAVVG